MKPSKVSSDSDFDFRSAIASFATAGKIPVKFIGTASSHFQDDPAAFGEAHGPKSDWEAEVYNNLSGLPAYVSPSCIKGKQKRADLPRFTAQSREYVDRATALGISMFRTSFDWARLCPRAGQFDLRLVEFYMRLCVDLRLRGIEPLICLNHFTMPLWLCGLNSSGRATIGAWEHRDVLTHFRYFVEQVSTHISNPDLVRTVARQAGADTATQDKLVGQGLVRYWMTFNEPIMVPIQGYVAGCSPPFKHLRLALAWQIMRKMVEAHDIAYHELKHVTSGFEGRESRIGVGYNWQYWDGPLGGLVHTLINELLYANLFEGNGQQSDFVGLHYYFRQTAGFHSRHGREYGDHPGFGDIYPAGIRTVLAKMHRAYPTKSIVVSEIGFADGSKRRGIPTDQRRPFWLLETVRHILAAVADGIPVEAVLSWTLVDSFEWHYGMQVPFGLMTLDDLHRPLPEPGPTIRSFEVWKAVAAALRQPTPANAAHLQSCYQASREQYTAHRSIYG